MVTKGFTSAHLSIDNMKTHALNSCTTKHMPNPIRKHTGTHSYTVIQSRYTVDRQ